MSEITISTGHPDAGRIYAEALDRVIAERDALRETLETAIQLKPTKGLWQKVRS